MADTRNSYMNNKGLSLVELLVALAVSSIVLAGLSFLMINVMKLYARTNANVELQNEAQTAMNLVLDNIMDASGLCMVEPVSVPVANDPANQPVCILLGNLKVNGADFGSAEFTGDAVVWDPDPLVQEMYLLTYEEGNPGIFNTSGAASESEAALLAIGKIQQEVLDLPMEDRLEYLLARNVTVFDVRIADYYTFPEPEDKLDPDNPYDALGNQIKKKIYYYNMPMVLAVHLEFEMEYQTGREVTRIIDDDAAIRSRLPYIFVYRKNESGMMKYICK